MYATIPMKMTLQLRENQQAIKNINHWFSSSRNFILFSKSWNARCAFADEKFTFISTDFIRLHFHYGFFGHSNFLMANWPQAKYIKSRNCSHNKCEWIKKLDVESTRTIDLWKKKEKHLHFEWTSIHIFLFRSFRCSLHSCGSIKSGLTWKAGKIILSEVSSFCVCMRHKKRKSFSLNLNVCSRHQIVSFVVIFLSYFSRFQLFFMASLKWLMKMPSRRFTFVFLVKLLCFNFSMYFSFTVENFCQFGIVGVASDVLLFKVSVRFSSKWIAIDFCKNCNCVAFQFVLYLTVNRLFNFNLRKWTRDNKTIGNHMDATCKWFRQFFFVRLFMWNWIKLILWLQFATEKKNVKNKNPDEKVEIFRYFVERKKNLEFKQKKNVIVVIIFKSKYAKCETATETKNNVYSHETRKSFQQSQQRTLANIFDFVFLLFFLLVSNDSK